LGFFGEACGFFGEKCRGSNVAHVEERCVQTAEIVADRWATTID
jgi:hypothetical protein